MDLLKKITKRGFSLSILIVALSFALFWAKGAISLDPDFGFRLKTGELILAEGIPKTDPYSYTNGYTDTYRDTYSNPNIHTHCPNEY
ncbi:hypothetical protein IID22_04155 [Patescibacteria group bacterium]|nr:hypothetical protein [Patescibacteria group bacterium]